MKLRAIINGGFFTLLAGIILFAGSCIVSVKTPTGNMPQLKITAPVDNASAGNVTVTVQISNFKLVPPQGNNRSRSSEGHIMFYLDQPPPTWHDNPAVTGGGTYADSADTSYTWTGVTPGTHTFSAQLVNNDRTPLIAPAVDTVTVVVGAPQGAPTLTLGPPDGSQLPPGIVIITATVTNFIVSATDTGSINRDGEGHLIYYLDEGPPTDAGQLAVTDTSLTTANPEQRWKNIGTGSHTFAVQLVNNDDTPLDPPVTANVTLVIQ